MQEKKKKHIWIVTIFPELFTNFFSNGVVASALRGERGNEFEVQVLNLHDYSPFQYKNVDDAPFGGGPGMIIRADVLKSVIDDIYNKRPGHNLFIVCPSPRGKIWDHDFASKFSKDHLENLDTDLVFICGRYEGIDERFLKRYVNLEISIGNYVLSGAELAVMSILDSSLRFLKGTLKNEESLKYESFSQGLLEYPQYTRPQEFEGEFVPKELLSGNHALIEKFRKEESMRITKKYRPDLLQKKEGHE